MALHERKVKCNSARCPRLARNFPHPHPLSLFLLHHPVALHHGCVYTTCPRATEARSAGAAILNRSVPRIWRVAATPPRLTPAAWNADGYTPWHPAGRRGLGAQRVLEAGRERCGVGRGGAGPIEPHRIRSHSSVPPLPFAAVCGPASRRGPHGSRYVSRSVVLVRHRNYRQ